MWAPYCFSFWNTPLRRGFCWVSPPKTSNNRKIESAWGTTLGMREKASLLSFHIPSCPARFFFLIGLCEEEGFFWVSTFNEVLQHLNAFIQTNFLFERVLSFAKEDAWISRLLGDAAFSWRPGNLLCGLKTLPILKDFAIFASAINKETVVDVKTNYQTGSVCEW